MAARISGCQAFDSVAADLPFGRGLHCSLGECECVRGQTSGVRADLYDVVPTNRW